MKQNILLIFIYLIISNTVNAQEKLIYVGDPMCSWCYGFAPELEKLIEKHKSQMDIELITGGLRPYFKKPINEMKDFLSHHWEDVNKASQQPFNYDILDQSDIIYDTEPACRAVVVVRHMDREKEFEFFKLIQEAFYYKNKNLTIAENYFPILDNLGLEKETFRKHFYSDEYKELVKEDFKRASALGVQGFPSLLLEYEGKLTILTRGYTSAEIVNDAINSVLKEN